MSQPSTSITIRPYVDPNVSNMGLEKYSMALFEGIVHEEQLACVEVNGIRRYLTNLNEFAPEVKLMAEPERSARIKEIRTRVAELERDLAANVLDIEDRDFWAKVKLLRPDNDSFWGSISLKAGNDPVYLEPKTNSYDYIKILAIEAGGFSMVAKSLEDARTRPAPPKFYLDRTEETAVARTEIKKIRNKALAELEKLYNKSIPKLLLVCKVVDANSAQYRKSTPTDVLYDNMDRFINGEGIEKNKQRAAQTFFDVAQLDMETLKLRALVKDASYYKFIAPRSDGYIYHMSTGAMLGKNPAEIVEHLKNPLNEEVLTGLLRTVDTYWNS